jgi:hypothetical protein
MTVDMELLAWASRKYEHSGVLQLLASRRCARDDKRGHACTGKAPSRNSLVTPSPCIPHIANELQRSTSRLRGAEDWHVCRTHVVAAADPADLWYTPPDRCKHLSLPQMQIEVTMQGPLSATSADRCVLLPSQLSLHPTPCLCDAAFLVPPHLAAIVAVR